MLRELHERDEAVVAAVASAMERHGLDGRYAVLLAYAALEAYEDSGSSSSPVKAHSPIL